MSDIDPARLVFVGGLHRSGTSLLSRLLGGHAAVSNLSDTGVWEDEGQHLQDVYPAADRLGGPGRFAFEEAAHLTEDSPLVTEAARDRLLRAWSPYWDLGRQLLLEKSPPNLVRFRYLRTIFPGAKLIAVIRHPVPVAYATQRFYRRPHRRWSRPSIQALIAHWIHAHRVFERDTSSLDGIVVVRYEDLTARPLEVLNEVAEGLGIAPFAAPPVDVQTDRSGRYFAAWRRHLARPVLGARRRRDAETLEDDVRRWGYSLFDERPTGIVARGP